MCYDKLFEITIFEEGRNTSKCYCREEIIVSDCVPAKAIAGSSTTYPLDVQIRKTVANGIVIQL